MGRGTAAGSGRFAGQVALVTGATSGIGRALARALTAEGAVVVGTGRDQARLMALEPEVDLALTMELRDEQSVRLGAAAALDRHGRIDLLLHNAGIGAFAPWEEAGPAEVQRVLDVNLLGAVRLTQAVLPAMVAAGSGTVGLVASVAGRRGYPRHTAYCASKHALVGWGRALHKDLRGTGVRVVTVCPPAVDTPFFESAGYTTFAQDHPGMRLMSAETAARGILDALARGAPMALLGGRAKLLFALERSAPGAMDRLQLTRDRLRGVLGKGPSAHD